MFITSFIKKTIKQNKGFSLAELMIVLGILTMGLLGIVSLIFQNMQVENLTKNYLVASMLGQEGIELARNIRDENWVNYCSWLYTGSVTDTACEIIGAGPNMVGTFSLDHRGRTSVNITPNVNGEPGTRLYLDSAGFYTHVVSPRTTAFYRLITVTEDTVNDYALVTSDVMWTGRFGEQHFTINTTLYNWRGDD